jgi:hypothetical protein
MEKFLGNWPIISPSRMKNDMNETNANYNPFPTIYVQDDLVSVFYELGLQGNPIVYPIYLLHHLECMDDHLDHRFVQSNYPFLAQV